VSSFERSSCDSRHDAATNSHEQALSTSFAERRTDPPLKKDSKNRASQSISARCYSFISFSNMAFTATPVRLWTSTLSSSRVEFVPLHTSPLSADYIGAMPLRQYQLSER